MREEFEILLFQLATILLQLTELTWHRLLLSTIAMDPKRICESELKPSVWRLVPTICKENAWSLKHKIRQPYFRSVMLDRTKKQFMLHFQNDPEPNEFLALESFMLILLLLEICCNNSADISKYTVFHSFTILDKAFCSLFVHQAQYMRFT